MTELYCEDCGDFHEIGECKAEIWQQEAENR